MSTATLETVDSSSAVAGRGDLPDAAAPENRPGAKLHPGVTRGAAEVIDIRADALPVGPLPGRTGVRPRHRPASTRPGDSGVAPPRVRRRKAVRASGCRIDALPADRPESRNQWRLTNRGIAVILVSGAMIAAAAITVITATALTVTSSDYHQPQTSIVGR